MAFTLGEIEIPLLALERMGELREQFGWWTDRLLTVDQCSVQMNGVTDVMELAKMVII